MTRWVCAGKRLLEYVYGWLLVAPWASNACYLLALLWSYIKEGLVANLVSGRLL